MAGAGCGDRRRSRRRVWRGNGRRRSRARGLPVAPPGTPHCDVCIETDASGWHLSPGNGEYQGEHQGADFAFTGYVSAPQEHGT